MLIELGLDGTLFFQLNTHIVMNFIFVIQSEGLRMCMPIA